MKKIIINLIFILALIGIIVYSLYLRFTNADMTETRLFITYWKQYLAITVVVLIGSILYYRKH